MILMAILVIHLLQLPLQMKENWICLKNKRKIIGRYVCAIQTPIVDVLAVNIILVVTCYSKINFYTQTHIYMY